MLPLNSNSIFDIVQTIKESTNETDPLLMAKSLGIIIRIDFELKKLNGMYFVIDNLRYIFINGNLPTLWRRIVCAHELGHDILHRDLAGPSLWKESAYLDLKTKPEYEANLFVAELLINDEDVLSLYQDGYNFKQMCYELKIESNFLALKLRSMKQRGIDLGCTIEPISNILGKIEIPTDSEFDYI